MSDSTAPARYRLTLAYDGRPFAGWQSQRVTAGRPTIQDTLETALASIGGPGASRVQASGRTDAGVHALGQIVHFDAPPDCRLGEAEWHRALNALLPPSLRVLRCARTTPDFHARFAATGKTYRYRLWHAEVLPPLEFGLAWHLYGRLDEAALRRAAPLFEGRHDFSAFSARRGDADEASYDKVRTLHRLSIETRGELITLTFHGDGFLYKMVRMLTGALVQVGRGRTTPERLADLLENPAQAKPGWQAPAEGLYLVNVEYPPPASPASRSEVDSPAE